MCVHVPCTLQYTNCVWRRTAAVTARWATSTCHQAKPQYVQTLVYPVSACTSYQPPPCKQQPRGGAPHVMPPAQGKPPSPQVSMSTDTMHTPHPHTSAQFRPVGYQCSTLKTLCHAATMGRCCCCCCRRPLSRRCCLAPWGSGSAPVARRGAHSPAARRGALQGTPG